MDDNVAVQQMICTQIHPLETRLANIEVNRKQTAKHNTLHLAFNTQSNSAVYTMLEFNK